jgi:hypothetical protein
LRCGGTGAGSSGPDLSAGFPGSGGRVCGSSDLQGRGGSLRCPPHTEGPRGWMNPPPSPTCGCAFARRTVSRRSHRLGQGPVHGGSSPIASAAVGFAAPLLGLQCSRTWPSRSLRSDARHTSWHALRAPPDLDADFPVASRSSRSDLAGRTASLGVSKDRPSIVQNRRVRRRGTRLRVPFGEKQPASPACRPRGFAPPRRFVPLRPCRSVSPCCRSWGSPWFPPVAKRASSRRLSCPSEPSPRRQRRCCSTGLAACLATPWVRVTGATTAGRPLHREPCLLTLHSGHREAGLPAHVRHAFARRLLGAGASRPCSIVGSVAIASVAGCGRPLLPWAWPISFGRHTRHRLLPERSHGTSIEDRSDVR